MDQRKGVGLVIRNAQRQRKGVLRLAIDKHCKQCVYDPCNGGTWREQVTLCTVDVCPLHPVRPLSDNAIVLLDGDFGHHQTSYKRASHSTSTEKEAAR